MRHQSLIVILALILQGVATTLNLMLEIAKETNETFHSLQLGVVSDSKLTALEKRLTGETP
jgi:hypothetical protein